MMFYCGKCGGHGGAGKNGKCISCRIDQLWLSGYNDCKQISNKLEEEGY